MNRPDAAEECAERTRVRDREATRQRILDSARELFTTEGYERVSSRLIAARAGVNVALINRYFGAKRGLLAEVIAEEAVFPGMFDGDPGTLPRRLAEYMVDQVLREPSPLRRALEQSRADPDLQAVYQERLRDAILEPMARHIGGPDARARASVAVGVVLGLGVLRRVEGATALRDSDRAALVARLESVFVDCLRE
ncbi:TetR/AcrR family transcriptional regulator [Marinitenerispora sediminis]|uniref:TetR family transcriptional regulator n=1 Tax=Marinitenerispora sediminis TaxID=1931232 RepID=A0A368SZH5_9ACTN|nr:TetR family transcriptional regulator [Marinitenerispora sediminis]RCV48876.1 TetR family transcriptional regulator [Marinitenerispora sediminis]RCV50848.1 TetR family transcriptional regulator [Marinitenerispora sediminis]RCV57294.1 TetR family transcriptional regulator [Marinitenerispora sediminis]